MVGLYTKFLIRLAEARIKCNKETIPFPYIFEKICRNFSINKKECWEYIFFLKEMGIIELIPYHGVKLNYKYSSENKQVTKINLMTPEILGN